MKAEDGNEKMQDYKTIKQFGESEIVEKKSRFLGKIKLVETEAEAIAYIENIKKQHWDARHNCFAYVIGANGETVRCSDDGEPSGTAGKPMLEVLQNQQLRNVVVVVTRYFGGVLLGTGGLVRAYTQATLEAIEKAGICTMTFVTVLTVQTDYNAIGRIKYLLAQEEITVLNEEYTTDVIVTIALPSAKEEWVINKITDVTNGKAVIDRKEQTFMAL